MSLLKVISVCIFCDLELGHIGLVWSAGVGDKFLFFVQFLHGCKMQNSKAKMDEFKSKFMDLLHKQVIYPRTVRELNDLTTSLVSFLPPNKNWKRSRTHRRIDK